MKRKFTSKLNCMSLLLRYAIVSRDVGGEMIYSDFCTRNDTHFLDTGMRSSWDKNEYKVDGLCLLSN